MYDLLDKYNPMTEKHSMARATGYPATMAIRMLAARLYDQKGISPPEFVIDAPNMKEKTLRYRGHIEKMAVMRETGLFSKQAIEINGRKWMVGYRIPLPGERRWMQ